MIKQENLNKVLNLVKKDYYNSTDSIAKKGKELGLWKNWRTYYKYLLELEKLGKIEKIKIKYIILWSKK